MGREKPPRRLAGRNLTQREAKARFVDCPRCGRKAGEACVSGDLDLLRAHNERWEAYRDFEATEYCRNEIMSGYPCGRPGCEVCGGGQVSLG